MTMHVLVTGASGFIASRIVEQLLAKGHRVRGTVRSLAKGKDLEPLRALPGASERLELVEADLLREGAFDDAAQGVEAVLHTASPYVLDAKDPQRVLVDPAVKGTRNVLEAAKKSSTVKRVVVTSSMAAITDEPESDHVLTEADWNEKSSLERNPYYYSKTLAERAAWDFVEREKPSFDLVVINPFLVIGPSLTPAINTSNQLFVDLLKGTYPGVMNLTWGFVDVRDVAEAHVRAIETPSAKGRYITAGDTVAMRAVVELLEKHGWGKGHKLPKLGMDCAAGDFAVRLSSYLQPKGVGSYLRTHVGRVPRYDNGKAKRELAIDFRPVERSILDTLDDMARWGHLERH
ncbi:MAG: aldehyde reductase [Deltaproteobacteria bacterium]|nr:aldehyde reductase [Deltaproteobacteria bacterium]